jgi:hypothetical protein
MKAAQFWAYVTHVDDLLPIAGAALAVVSFFWKRLAEFLAARAALVVTTFKSSL